MAKKDEPTKAEQGKPQEGASEQCECHAGQQNMKDEQARTELNELRARYEETKDLLQRMQAEFDNYRKRLEKEQVRIKAFACSDIIAKLLPVLDSFEQAMKSKDAQGIRLLYQQLLGQLEAAGLRKIDCTGKQFDPYLHEVLLKEASDKEEGTVIEEIQAGYMLNGMIIRHPKVKISGPKEDNAKA